MTPEITRIRAALAAWNDADNGRQEDAALDLLHHAVGPEQITAVMAHIDAQQAEIERLKVANKLLDAALIKAFSDSEAFSEPYALWSAARKLLTEQSP